MSMYSIGSRYPTLPPSNEYWIADSATVVGDVHINSHSSVWFGASIRGDNAKISLGDGSNVQENCVLHTDIGFPIDIGKNCTIGHGAILHGCFIGNNCIIGMGSIILNGAKIGDNCIIGAGSLITEGKNFLNEKKLILGSPAKVIRVLKSEEKDNILKSALSYQSKATEFKNNLKNMDF